MKKIGVLMGGPSQENRISIISGQAVSKALSENGENVTDIIIPDEFENIEELKEKTKNLIKKSNIDVAFIALHGWFGEDGQIQELLENLRIPYTGSGSVCCRKAMDKVLCHEILRKNSISVPRYRVLRDKGEKLDYKFLPNGDFPVVIKPSSQGSSIGLTIAYNFKELERGKREAFKYGNEVLIEEYLGGRELTVGILGEETLPVIEIIPKEKFYNYKAKYEDELTEFIIPAKADKGLLNRLKEISFSVFKVLGCKGFARVDIKTDDDSNPKVLEINTIPGLTSHSLLPKAAKSVNIDFSELCSKILKYADLNLCLKKEKI